VRDSAAAASGRAEKGLQRLTHVVTIRAMFLKLSLDHAKSVVRETAKSHPVDGDTWPTSLSNVKVTYGARAGRT
jgi:hypothetical protein